MTNHPSSDEPFCTLELTRKQVNWLTYILTFAVIVVLAVWVVVSESSIHTKQIQQIEQLQNDLNECVAEATAWYNSSTALSDAIVREAMRGGLAEQVDTNVATAFAVKGHELKCIEPKFPTG